uniref:Xylem serine proteinase 1 n=1 Tax=Anthurium amnicola TaxID=1678845 RepID=A0A1D1Y7Q3_9ARAE
MMSGTSVATPHLASVAAMVKKKACRSPLIPAAILSAIMTSSYYLDNKLGRIHDETGGAASLLAMGAVDCASLGKLGAEKLNYPSISVKVSTAGKKVERTVRNEGPVWSTYVAEVVGLPPGPVSVDVQPGVLNFGAKGEEQTFRVTFSLAGGGGGRGTGYEGHLKWAATTSIHVVSSPLLVTVG